MADPIGALRVELAASTAKFLSDLEKASKGLKKTGKDGDDFGEQLAKAGKIAAAGIAAITAAATAAFAVMAKVTQSYAASGDELAKLSDKTGDTVERLSDLREVALLSGGSVESLQNAYRQMSVSTFEAARGSKEYADVFKQLNIEIYNGQGQLKTAQQLMYEFSDRLATMGNATERAAVTQKLLTRAGQENLPMLIKGSAAMKDLEREVRELGYGFTEASSRAGEEFNDNLRKVGIVAEGVRNIFGEAFLPVLNDVVQEFLAWYRANNQLLKQKIKEFAEGAAAGLREVSKELPGIARNVHELASDLGKIQDSGLLSIIGNLLKAAFNIFQWFFDAVAASVFYFVVEFMKPFELLPLGVGDAIKKARGVWETEMESWRGSMERDAQDLIDSFNNIVENFKPKGEVFGPPAPTPPPTGGKGGGTKGGGMAPPIMHKPFSDNVQVFLGEKLRTEHIDAYKREQQALGELFMLREKFANQIETTPLELFKFDPTKGNEQTYAVKALMELMPELTNEEARLLAIHNQDKALDVVGSERMRAATAKDYIATLQEQTAEAQKFFDNQAEFYQSYPTLIGAADAAREAGFELLKKQEAEKLALLNETARQEGQTAEQLEEKKWQLWLEFDQKRRGLVRQFPGFWEQQLQALVSSNAFSIGTIVSSWTSGLAQALVRWDSFTEVIKSVWQQTQIALLQGVLNTGVQAVAVWAQSWARKFALDEAGQATAEAQDLATKTTLLGQQEAFEAAKTAIAAQSEAARLALTEGTNKAIAVASIASLSSIAAVGTGAILIMEAVMLSVTAMLTAIASALAAGVVTAPLSGPVSAAAGLLGQSSALLTAAGLAAIQAATGAAAALAMPSAAMALGGIATGPISALIGEGGSPEAVIPLNSTGAAFMSEMMGMKSAESNTKQEIYVMLDKDLIGRASADYTMKRVYALGI